MRALGETTSSSAYPRRRCVPREIAARAPSIVSSRVSDVVSRLVGTQLEVVNVEAIAHQALPGLEEPRADDAVDHDLEAALREALISCPPMVHPENHALTGVASARHASIFFGTQRETPAHNGVNEQKVPVLTVACR